MSEPVVQRIVPGAPAPTPLSKSQRKKRKAKQGKSEGDDTAGAEATPATPIDTAPEPSEVREGSLAPEVVAQSEPTASPLPEEEVLLKPSPIVELVHKRLKATTKKITRISSYQATDPEKLNDDQKRTLKTLSTLEAVQKELGEVKKAIEVHEAELVQELAAKRAEAEKAEKARVKNAVENAQNNFISRTSDILTFLRLRPSLATGAFDGPAFFADESERSAFISLADALLSEDEEQKQTALTGFLFGTGDFDSLPFTRISEIVQSILNPPRPPTPQESVIDDRQQSVSASSNVDETEAPVVPAPEGVTTSSSFHFMQESELEPPFEEKVEWVEKTEESVPAPAAPVESSEVPPANGRDFVATAVGTGGSTLDWSADNEGESDLPPIEHLKASGSATPAETPVEEAPAAPAENGQHAKGREEDGFTTARGAHRGERGVRGRHYRGEHQNGEHRGGYRGYRGGERGAYRGGDRGPYRGGERGGYRGGERGGFAGGEPRDGEFRGGERGGYRGGYRGGDRGGPRGRGDWRGDGERGGRGRGRGRGGDRGGAPQQQPPATPSAA